MRGWGGERDDVRLGGSRRRREGMGLAGTNGQVRSVDGGEGRRRLDRGRMRVEGEGDGRRKRQGGRRPRVRVGGAGLGR